MLPSHHDSQLLAPQADVFLDVAKFEGLLSVILDAMSAMLPCTPSAHLLVKMDHVTPEDSLVIGAASAWIERLLYPSQRHALGETVRRVAKEGILLGRSTTEGPLAPCRETPAARQ